MKIKRRLSFPLLILTFKLFSLFSLPTLYGEQDFADLDNLVDTLVTDTMKEQNVAGAVVTIVQGDQILINNGYGYADFETGRLADGDTTPFRLASVTKLITWTAVMQLYEQNRLDLNADIETYLDFSLKRKYEEPITMIHLLSHSAGFEDSYFGFETADIEKIIPLNQWIKNTNLRQVMPPGQAPAYSNYGAALACYIVQRVSGMPFEEYVDQFIFTPLGMNHSSVAQPYPDTIEEIVVKGHDPITDDEGRVVFETDDGMFMHSIGDGSLASSGADMAAFMLAILNEGIFGDNRILKPETVRMMLSLLLKPHPELNGMCYGFYQQEIAGMAFTGHGGDIACHHSNLLISPEHRLGIFVSINSDTGTDLMTSIAEAVVQNYFHDSVESPEITPVSDIDLSLYTGNYVMNRRGYTHILKLLSITTALPIEEKEGRLVIPGMEEDEHHFIPVSRDLFYRADGQDKMGFLFNENGDIDSLILNNAPMFLFRKTGFLDDPAVHVAVLIAVIASAILWLAIRLVLFIIRKFKNPPLSESGISRWLKRLTTANALLIPGVTAALIIIILNYLDLYIEGEVPVFGILLAFPMIITGVTLGLAVMIIRRWNDLKMTERIQYTGAVLLSGLFIWFCTEYNLLGWNLF